MKSFIRSSLRIWIPVLIGVMMLALPLLRNLHIESALVVSLAGCFWAAVHACSKSFVKSDGQRILDILSTLYLVALPLFLYALFTGCLSMHGIGFWVFYPIPGVLLGYSLGRLLRMWGISYRKIISISVFVFIAAGILLIEFFNFPQVYFFNHVWGGWPGPIYDETVKVTWSLIFFRGLTLAWAGLLWWIPVYSKSIYPKVVVIGGSLLLIVGYSQLAERGIITTRSYLKGALGGVRETKHFAIYYSENYYSDDEIRFIAQKHEFYFRQITSRLNISWPENGARIESFLYAHPWQKKELVGAKFTSYVPVWLNHDQLHIAKPQIAGSLKHELVHVVSKQFGNTIINASWSIGLIEGLAVALAPDASSTSTIDQIVVSEKPYPTAPEMQAALSPWGFYGGRSAVNYTQSGSFVRYLLNNYPVNSFKNAYRSGNIKDAYPASFKELTEGWHHTLDTVQVDSVDRQVARRLYAVPSLFEQACPHVQSAFAQYWDRYQFFMAERDTAQALQYLEQARRQAPQNKLLKNQWAFLNLKTGNIQRVQQQAALTDTTVDGLLLSADAFAMAGDLDTARRYVSKAAQYMPTSQDDPILRGALQTRRDSLQWHYYRQIIYDKQSISDSAFARLNHRTQIRAMQQALGRHNTATLRRYAIISKAAPLDNIYFDTYNRLIEWLALDGQLKQAHIWWKRVSALALRVRQREQITETEEWIEWLEKMNN